MIAVLRESERKLTEQAKRVTDDKLKVLSEQMKSTEMSLSVLEDVEDYVEQSLKTGSPQQVLRSKKQMMERMSKVTGGINVEELHPKEKADFGLSKDIKSLHHIGDIVTSTALQQCRVKKIDHITPASKAVSFSLSMEAPDSSVLCVPVSSLWCSLVPVGKGDEPIDTTVTTTSTDPGVYRIQCNPSTSGTHTVKVQVYDVHLEDISLIIPFNPYLDNIIPVRTITELKHPMGVTISDDNHVIISENNGDCVTILDREGKKVKSLGGKGGSGNVKFSGPHSVAITPDKFILVSDNHRIQKISMDGYLIASVGEWGSGPLQFQYPSGIAISPITGQVYIADRDNHHIQVLNPDLTFSHSFGSKGSANGQLKYPRNIAIDSQGLVYVADRDNNRIQKFSPDGKFVSQFGTEGSGPGQLDIPIGITIDTTATGLVYVSEGGNNRISVFTSDGVFVITHKDHKYNLIADSFTKHKEALEKSLIPVKGKIEGLKKFLSALAEREGEIRERGEGVLEEIHEMVEEMMNVLCQSERKLTEQAKRVTDDKLKVLSEQMKSAEMSLSVLEDVEDYVEQSLKTGSPQQVLRSKKQMMERMSEVTSGINVEELHPKEKADFGLSKDIKSLHHIGDIVSPQQCRVKKIDDITPGLSVSFSLSMEAPDSSVLCVPVSSLRCSLVPVGKGDEPIHTTVTTTSTDPGVYRIQCNPSTRGTHTVKVQVYDVHLEDTSLFIPFNPYLDNITPVRTITELKGPWGVAVTDDNRVIVTEFRGHCVTILDREGKKVRSLGGEVGSGNVKFCGPSGIAITPDKFILVSDRHRIQKIGMDGCCQSSVGEEGSGPLQFFAPSGIAISPITGQVYIADRNNHRIQVLNPDLTFSHSFGSRGSANGQFKYPNDIAIDSQGLVYVTDSHNHRIQKFSPDGKFMGQFGTEGFGPGQLNMPVGITMDTAATGLVYVSEWVNHRISVFTSDGVFVSKFGSKGSNIDQFNNPYGSTFDKNGHFYVCDWTNNRLVVY
uniref:B-box C-terminal domain-containing protein n=1 Tax=Amphimedon queenslandica TaxID=400682 RepID=A0A1X7TVC5_AMPQE